MLSQKKLTIFIITTIFLINLTACSDNSVSVDDSVATIQGSVESAASKANAEASEAQAGATTVTAARITSNGSFDVISETETDVDASGRFTLEVDASSLNEVAILVESNGETLKGYLSANIENGQSYILKPVNSESTAETMVFAKIVANGKTNLVHKSDIETVVRQGSAATVRTSNSASNQVSAAVENSADARMSFFSEFGDNDAGTDISTWFEVMTDAQADFESSVSNNASAGAKDAAFDVLLDAKLFAYSETGLDEVSVSKLLHMQGKVKQNSLGSASSEVRSDVRASSSLLTALAIDNAVQARAEASGMSEATISAIAEAGATLRGDVKASAGSESTINAAFETYREEVRTAIENDSSAEGSVVVAIDVEINATGGSKFIFQSAISGILNLSVLNDAYATYASSVRSSVESKSEVIGSVEADAMADILLLINLF